MTHLPEDRRILPSRKKPRSERPVRKRTYNSPLRAGQAEQTRDQILEALVRAMARDGIADLSIPVVAREAGVSVATVYRYFATRRDLMNALVDYTRTKGGFEIQEEFPDLKTPEDLARIVPDLFDRRGAIDPTVFTAMGTEAGYEVRRPLLEARRAYLSKVLAPATKGRRQKEKDLFTDVAFVLTSSTSVRAFRDYLGLESREAAERVAWAIRKLAEAAARESGALEPDENARGRR
jgi:AcrR family transcriptional regulator